MGLGIGRSAAARRVGGLFRVAGGGGVSSIRFTVAIFCLGLAACVETDQPGEAQVEQSAEPPKAGFYVLHADGAVAPKGLSTIRGGMTQEEVLEILGPLYQIKHAADAWLGNPLVDYFTYFEGDGIKYGEVHYLADRVEGIRFGYSEAPHLKQGG